MLTGKHIYLLGGLHSAEHVKPYEGHVERRPCLTGDNRHLLGVSYGTYICCNTGSHHSGLGRGGKGCLDPCRSLGGIWRRLSAAPKRRDRVTASPDPSSQLKVSIGSPRTVIGHRSWEACAAQGYPQCWIYIGVVCMASWCRWRS